MIVQRFREERDRGLERYDAISRAGATASRTVVFSGIAVAIALAGMLFKSFGIGTMVVVVTAVAAALTLLPALLGLLGDRVNWLTIPIIDRRRPPESGGGFWGAITGVVTAHPAISVVVTAALLIGLTAPVTTLELGSGGIIRAEIVVLAPDVSESSVQRAIEDLTASLASDDFFGTAESTISANGDLVDIRVSIAGDISSDESIAGIRRLRDDYIPAAFAGVNAEVLVGGGTAEVIDSVAIVWQYAPLIMAAVLAASFLLLLIAFRSIVVPLKAVVMNLLSVGAAYGMVVLVFQKGVGSSLFGFQEVPVIGRVGRRRVTPCGALSRRPPAEPCMRLSVSHGSPVTHIQVLDLDDTDNSFGVTHLAYLPALRAGAACSPSPCAWFSPARTTMRAP